jgi:hypothetical protein
MARNTLEAWIPEEYDSSVIIRIQNTSAIEATARKIPMKSDTKWVPRTAGMDVELIPKGGAYGEDTSLNDSVLLTVYKFGKALRIAEEDIGDSVADLIAAKKTDWGTSYARMLDNSALGTTAAANGTTVAFTSIYRALSQTDAATGYTAGQNLSSAGVNLGTVALTAALDLLTSTQAHGLAVGDKFKVVTSAGGFVAGTTYFVRSTPSSTTWTASSTLNGPQFDITADSSTVINGKTGVINYDNLSDVLSFYEGGDYFDEANTVIYAHPTVKSALRKVKNSVGDPMFVQGDVSTKNPDTIFGYPIKWTLGARTSAVSTSKPTGNPLVIFANTDYVFLGVRSGPESMAAGGDTGASMLTDEALIKMRSRRAFALANPFAAAVLELS